METLSGSLIATYRILLESSFFMILGLFVAGLIRAFAKPDFVTRHFGSGRIKSVIYASMIGIPIPI
ncbi:MAG: hypothetical protein PHS86_13305 [Syntrophaceae bacterium]|nr:hypothetical protein [Syntrophaceae bacterium]